MNAHLIRTKGNRIEMAFPVAEGGTEVGRDAGCLVQLTDARVSKRHARLSREGEAWSVEDLGSKNGTRLNGAAVQGKASLRDGDRVAFASEEFIFTTRPMTGSTFTPFHVIDFSSGIAHRTIQKPPAGPEGAGAR